jgi:hypothetical protein
VTVSEVSPLNSGTTNPTVGTYTVAENSLYSVTATPLSGYVFDHWELDGANVGSVNPYSFNVGISSHTISAFFTQLLSAQIDGCDSLTNWMPRYSALSVDNADYQEGNGAIVVSTTTTAAWSIYAILQEPMDLSQYSTLQMWIKPTDATKTLRLMIATNWSNYNIYTITGLTSNTWTLISIDLASPTSRTGTINFSSISFLRFDYEVRSTTASFKIDDIRGVY